MRRSLFWRTYSVLLAALLATIAIFTGVLVASRRQAMQESYESEVRLQAREVADYMANLNTLSYVQTNATMRYLIRRKIASIYNTYLEHHPQPRDRGGEGTALPDQGGQ